MRSFATPDEVVRNADEAVRNADEAVRNADEVVRNAAEALEDLAAESRADGVELVQPSAAADVDVPRGCALTSVSLALAAPAG